MGRSHRQGVTMTAPRLVLSLQHGPDDPEAVAIAYQAGISALREGGTVLMWLTKDAVVLAIEGGAAGIRWSAGPTIEELHDEYVGRGGELSVCATSVRLRGLVDARWIHNARIDDAASLWQLAADGARFLNF